MKTIATCIAQTAVSGVATTQQRIKFLAQSVHGLVRNVMALQTVLIDQMNTTVLVKMVSFGV